MTIVKFFENLNSYKHFNKSICNVAKIFGLEIDEYSILLANYYHSFHVNWRMSKQWLSHISFF